MAPGVRLKKSLNGSRTFGRRKNTKFESDDGDSHRKQYSDRPKFRSNPRNGEGEGRGYSSTEKQFGRRGGDSGYKKFGRRPSNGERSDFVREDSSGTRERRGERREGRRRRVEIPHRSEVIDELRSRGRKLGWKRRVEREVNSGETVGGKARELRGDHRRTRVDGGGDDSDRSHEMRGSRERREGRRSEKIPSKSEETSEIRFTGRKLGRKPRDENGVNSSDEMDRSVDSVEASSDKFRLKWKKMDKKRKDDGSDFAEGKMGRHGGRAGSYRDKGKNMVKGDAKEEQLENGSDQGSEEKPVRRLTRVLDKTGKKIRVVQKSTDVSADKLVPAKKKRRVIKLDPYDISNKRLDDTAPSNEKNEENDTEISKNAEFRAIQPSPSILSFVEDNLLGRRRLNELKNAGYNIKLSAPLDNVPFSTCTERERIEENVFRNKLEFFAAAKISSSFPPPTLPEIAFAGRSNVGKSSLLNALTRQWGVVRTSDKPGLTQTINFFKLASKLSLVDLPGYGFAYAKEEVKDAWEELVKEYVSTRVGLERVCVLVDTKWGMKPRDHELIDLMERSQTPYQIVLTKTDLVFPIDVARRAMQIQDNLKKNKSIINPVMMVSSKSGAGIRNLRTVLSKLTRFVKP